MKVKKGGRVNPSMSKGRDNFFVTKKSTDKPSNSSSSDNFFVQKKNPIKTNFNQDKDKVATRGNSFTSRKRGNSEKRSKEDNAKKPFDKKKWRLQKYSKKYKLDQWGEKRKTAVLKDYHKQVEGEHPKLNVQKMYEQYAKDIETLDNEETEDQRVKSENEHNANVDSTRVEENSRSTGDKVETKKLPFKKARMEFQKKKNEKNVKKQEALKRKNEQDAALKQYKEKKMKKFKKLNQKTKKGQPIMKARIEMLLEQIQASKASTN